MIVQASPMQSREALKVADEGRKGKKERCIRKGGQRDSKSEKDLTHLLVLRWGTCARTRERPLRAKSGLS